MNRPSAAKKPVLSAGLAAAGAGVGATAGAAAGAAGFGAGAGAVAAGLGAATGLAAGFAAAFGAAELSATAGRCQQARHARRARAATLHEHQQQQAAELDWPALGGVCRIAKGEAF